MPKTTEERIIDLPYDPSARRASGGGSSSSGGGATAFLGLSDTPSSYAGKTLYAVRVNAGETALEFVLLDTDDIGEGAALYFTDERAQDAIGSALTDSSSIDFTYNDGAGTITAAIIDEYAQDLMAAMLTGGTHTDISVTYNDAGGTIDLAYTGVPGGGYTQEQIEDFTAAQFTGNTGIIDATYDDGTGAITLTLDVSAADRILYSTGADAWAETALTAYARTLLDDADAATARTTLGVTVYDAETAQDTIGGILVDGNGIDLTYNDATPSITAALTTLTSEWDIGEDMSIRAERLEARDAEGLRLEDDGGNLGVYIADGGAVAVGNGTPLSGLHVFRDSAVATLFVERTGSYSGTDELGLVQFRYAGDSLSQSRATRDGANDAADFRISTQAAGGSLTDRMAVKSDGKVGIGTMSPAALLSVKAGESTNDAAVGGVLYVSTTQVGNVGTGDDTLHSYSLPANSLATNNQSISIKAFGSCNSGKTIRVKFGSTTIVNLISVGSGEWSAEAWVFRTGATTQKCFGRIMTSGAGSGAYDGHINYITASETLSGAVTIAITGEGTSNNDVICQMSIIEFLEANT